MQTQLKALPPLNVPSPVSALAVDSTGLWAGGLGGIAFYDGSEWHTRFAGLTLSSITALLRVGNWLIAGGTDGIARSGDGGVTWQPCPVKGGAPTIAAIVASPKYEKDKTLLAASINMGTLRSDDEGQTWEVSAFALESYEVLALLWTKDGALIAGTTNGLYRSPNAGRAWRLSEHCAPVTALTQLPNGALLAALETGELMVSTDKGDTWEAHDNNLPEGAEISMLAGTLLGTSNALYTGSDDGATWTQLLEGTIFSLTNAPDGTPYAGVDGGVMRGGASGWTELPPAPIHDVRQVIALGDDVLVAGRLSALLKYHAGAWHPLGGVPLPLSLVMRQKELIYASGIDGLYVSSDQGASWLRLWAEGYLSHLAFQPNGVGYGSRADGTQLVRTLDAGATWQTTKSPFGVLPVVALAATDTMIFAGIFDPRRRVIGLWRSTDGGQRWFPGAEIPAQWGLAAAFPNPPMLALPNALLVGGPKPDDPWTSALFDQPGVQVRTITGDAAVQYALSLTQGIFESHDQGRQWHHVPLDLPEDQIMDISYDAGHLVILLVGGRVYTT